MQEALVMREKTRRVKIHRENSLREFSDGRCVFPMEKRHASHMRCATKMDDELKKITWIRDFNSGGIPREVNRGMPSGVVGFFGPVVAFLPSPPLFPCFMAPRLLSRRKSKIVWRASSEFLPVKIFSSFSYLFVTLWKHNRNRFTFLE